LVRINATLVSIDLNGALTVNQQGRKVIQTLAKPLGAILLAIYYRLLVQIVTLVIRLKTGEQVEAFFWTLLGVNTETQNHHLFLKMAILLDW